MHICLAMKTYVRVFFFFFNVLFKTAMCGVYVFQNISGLRSNPETTLITLNNNNVVNLGAV